MSYQTKTLPSSIIIENRSNTVQKYRWYIKGTYFLHNEGEPAVEYKNGNKFWYQHHKFHRLDGPAMEYRLFDRDGSLIHTGGTLYYINSDSYEEEDYWKHPEVKRYMYLKEHPELEAFV